MQTGLSPLIGLSLDQHRLTDNFRLIQRKIHDYDRRLDALDCLTDEIQRGLRLEKVQTSERFDGLELKLYKGIEHKITNSINFYVSAKIKEFFQANESGRVSSAELESKLQRRFDEMKAAMKAQLIHENQDLIRAEIREIKRKDRKKEKEEKEKRLLYSTPGDSFDPELASKLEQVFAAAEQASAAIRQTTKKIDKLEETNYNSTSQLNLLVENLSEDMKECRKFVTNSNESMKMDMVKLKTQIMIPLEKNKPVNEEAIISGFAQLRQHMAKTLTKAEFESLHSKNLWNTLNQLKDEVDSLRKQVKSHEEQRNFLGHITEGIEKYEQFINNSFEKTTEKQESIRQAFAIKYDSLSSEVGALRATLLETVNKLDATSEFSHESARSFEERWTSLEYQHNLTKQEIQRIDANIEAAKQQIDNSNYSMKHMASEFDRKVNQTVSQLKESMKRLKSEFDMLYAAQAKKSEITELWKAVNIFENKLQMYKAEADQVYHLNKKSWMLAESEIVRGKGSLERLSHTVFSKQTQKNSFKMSELGIKTTRLKPKEDSVDE